MADDAQDPIAVPDWVPELSGGARADVYPVSPRPPGATPDELVLDRDTVTAGYSEHRPPYEFASLLPSAPSPHALLRVRAALSALRRARPSAPQRVVLAEDLAPPDGCPGAARRPSFPLQKPSGKSALETWFNKLASGGAFTTSALSRAVPLGSSIVRAVGRVLEMMAARGVPTQRAVWYIRIAVLNECVKQIRPDRPAPGPRLFWTRQLSQLLKAECDAMRARRFKDDREPFWHYVLDLARWQADEALLDFPSWLDRIANTVRADPAAATASTPSARVVLRAAETFLPEFSVSPLAAAKLCIALAHAVDAAGGARAVVALDPPSPPQPPPAAAASAAAPAALAAPASSSSHDPHPSSAQPAIAPSPTHASRLRPAARVAVLLKTLLPVAQQATLVRATPHPQLQAQAQNPRTPQPASRREARASPSQVTAAAAAAPPPLHAGAASGTGSAPSTPRSSRAQVFADEFAALVSAAASLPPPPAPTGAFPPLVPETGPDLPAAVAAPAKADLQSVSRMLERLPACGDVAAVRTALLEACEGDKDLGSIQSAAVFLCAWAVRGPMRNSPLAVPSAVSVLVSLADQARALEGAVGVEEKSGRSAASGATASGKQDLGVSSRRRPQAAGTVPGNAQGNHTGAHANARGQTVQKDVFMSHQHPALPSQGQRDGVSGNGVPIGYNDPRSASGARQQAGASEQADGRRRGSAQRSGGVQKPAPPAPAFQSEIWVYIKSLHVLRGSNACNGLDMQEKDMTHMPRSSAAFGSDDSGVSQDVYGFFVDPDGDSEDMRVVRLLARMYRVGEFSLAQFTREISRIVTESPVVARRLLVYLSALPEPSDRRAADARRSLLRRGQKVVGNTLGVCDVDEGAVSTAAGDNVRDSVTEGLRLRNSAPFGSLLATAESVMELEGKPPKSLQIRVACVLGFLSAAGLQELSVEWILRQCAGHTVPPGTAPQNAARAESGTSQFLRDPAAVVTMVYALDNLAPTAAALGCLQQCIVSFAMLYSGYSSRNLEGGKAVLPAIESVSASYSAMFAPNGGSGNACWPGWVAHVASGRTSKRLAAALLTGNPESTSSISEATLSLLRRSGLSGVKDKGGQAVWNSESTEVCFGLTPDQDLARMSSSGMSPSVHALAQHIAHGGDGEGKTPDSLLGPWATANTVLGAVVVPQMNRAMAMRSGDGQLAAVVRCSLRMLSESMFEHDLRGARPSLVIELLALLGAVSLSRLPTIAAALSDLLAKPWVRSVLLPRAGSEVIERLGVRVNSLLNNALDATVLTTFTADSATSLFGDSLYFGDSRVVDEGVVIRLSGWVEWGVAELFLSVLAAQRLACGQVSDFASLVSDAIADVRLVDQAPMVVSSLMKCLPPETLGIVVSQVASTSVRGLSQCLDALVGHVVADAMPHGRSISKSERESWAGLDRARCAIVNSLLSQVALGRVVLSAKMLSTELLQPLVSQIQTACGALKESAQAGSLAPDLSVNGRAYSLAVEGRFRMLESLVSSCSTPSSPSGGQPSPESIANHALDVDDIRSDLLAVGTGVTDLMSLSAPLLLPDALESGLRVLRHVLSTAQLQGMDGMEVDPPLIVGGERTGMASAGTCDPAMRDAASRSGGGDNGKVSLREYAWNSLQSKLCWLELSQERQLRTLCQRCLPRFEFPSCRTPLSVMKSDLTEVDTWYLLEGYGTGAEEVPAIPLTAFGVQRAALGSEGGIREKKGQHSSEQQGVSVPDPDAVSGDTNDRGVTRLKRTYSTYACMAVR